MRATETRKRAESLSPRKVSGLFKEVMKGCFLCLQGNCCASAAHLE